MSRVRRAVRRIRVPPRIREELRGRARAQDLGVGSTLGDWRAVSDEGLAPRFGFGELIGSQVTRAGRWSSVDPLRTPRLPRKRDVLGVTVWAGVIGTAGWRAWKRHGGLSGAREELGGR